MVPKVTIELKNLSYAGLKVSRQAFIISFLILTENVDLLFWNLFTALRISFLVIEKSRGRECWPWRSFSCSSLQIFCWARLRGSFEWRVWKSNFRPRLMGHPLLSYCHPSLWDMSRKFSSHLNCLHFFLAQKSWRCNNYSRVWMGGGEGEGSSCRLQMRTWFPCWLQGAINGNEDWEVYWTQRKIPTLAFWVRKLFLVKNCRGWQAVHLYRLETVCWPLIFGSNKHVLCLDFPFFGRWFFKNLAR